MSKKKNSGTGQAGTTEKNDILVKVELRESGGLEVKMKSSQDSDVTYLMGKDIERKLSEWEIKNVLVETRDEGGPQYGQHGWVVEARLETALRRAGAFFKESIKTPRQTLNFAYRQTLRKKTKTGLPTSKLFVPGNNPRRILKPTTLEEKNRPGGVILDLKNSVLKEDKDAARTLVRNALLTVDFGNMETIVRINPFNDRGYEDLKEIIPAQPYAIFIPRCEEIEDILDVEEWVVDLERSYGLKDKIYLIAGIQTAKGVMEAYNIAQASERLIGLSFGGEELTEDLGIKRTRSEDEILMYRQMVILAARAAGLDAEDTPYPKTPKYEYFEKELRKFTLRGKALGFVGRKAIHPAQIPIIREIFEKPSEKEVKWAKKAIAAFEKAKKKGQGTTSLNGKLIDRPIVDKAKAVLVKVKKWENT